MLDTCSNCLGAAVFPSVPRATFPSIPEATFPPVELGVAEPGRVAPGLVFFFGLLVGAAGTVLLTDRQLMQRERMRWAATFRRRNARR